MTTGKIIALTRRTLIDKVISCFLICYLVGCIKLVITFLPRSKRLLISWLQSPSAVILEPRKIKSATVSTVSPYISHEVMGPDAMILVFPFHLGCHLSAVLLSALNVSPLPQIVTLMWGLDHCFSFPTRRWGKSSPTNSPVSPHYFLILSSFAFVLYILY